jgi:hypothetical protein
LIHPATGSYARVLITKAHPNSLVGEQIANAVGEQVA